jgi:hypothetical protein
MGGAVNVRTLRLLTAYTHHSERTLPRPSPTAMQLIPNGHSLIAQHFGLSSSMSLRRHSQANSDIYAACGQLRARR